MQAIVKLHWERRHALVCKHLSVTTLFFGFFSFFF